MKVIRYPRRMNIKRSRYRWLKKIASKYGVVVKVETKGRYKR